MAYTVDDTPGKGCQIAFRNKELDPDSGIPFRLPVLIKESSQGTCDHTTLAALSESAFCNREHEVETSEQGESDKMTCGIP